jgi:diguanylate cyclase
MTAASLILKDNTSEFAAKDWSAIVPDLPVTMSVGIANHSKGETIEKLLHRADLALYEAKNAGRNVIVSSRS